MYGNTFDMTTGSQENLITMTKQSIHRPLSPSINS